MEEADGAVDGVNRNFTLPNGRFAVLQSMRVWVNGVALPPASVDQVSTTSFTLAFAPESGPVLVAFQEVR